MKVLFSNLPWLDFSDEANPRKGIRAGSRWPHTIPLTNAPGEHRHGGYLPYPMFMGYAATYAAKHCPNDIILFRDSIARHETYNQFFTFLLKEKPDLIIVETATPSWEHDRLLIGAISELLPGARFALTGTLASVRGDAMLSEKAVVAVVKGEYEKGITRVLKGATGILEHDLLTEAEMNAAPFPYCENSTARNYWDSNPAGIVYPNAQVWSSRGCFHKCSFCQWPATMTGNDPDGLHKRAVRFYSADYMEAYLIELLDKYGFRSIYFDDDTFNLSDRHTLAMCGVMRKIGLPWSAMCRADTSTPEVWAEMKASGCYGVKIGFETGSQRVMDEIINKKLNLAEAEETGKLLTSLGLSWHGTFMTGAPGATIEEDAMTHALIERCKANGMQTYQLSRFAVHDGTPADTLVRSGGAPMKVYPGAKLDENFTNISDGNAVLDSADALAVKEICARVPGYSDLRHYEFFKMLLAAEPLIKSLLMLGVYHGRDICFILSALRRYHEGRDMRIVGVDKFSDTACADWPEEGKNFNWEQMGMGAPPSRESARDNINCEAVKLWAMDDAYFMEMTRASFDCIYIDTAHDYKTVRRQLNHVRLIANPGAIICGDDYPNRERWGVERAVKEAFTHHEVFAGVIWWAKLSDLKP